MSSWGGISKARVAQSLDSQCSKATRTPTTRRSATCSFVHTSTDCATNRASELPAHLRKSRSYTIPLWPVSASSKEYQQLKAGQCKPVWHYATSESKDLSRNSGTQAESHSEDLQLQNVREDKKESGLTVDGSGEDPNIVVKVQRWALAQKMCRRVRRAALKTTSDVHVEFVPHSRIDKALGGNVAVQVFFSNLGLHLEADRQCSLHKTLVVLCLMDCPTKIRHFVHSGLCDKDLPLIVSSSRIGKAEVKVLRRKDDPQGPYVRFKTTMDTDNFLKKQWSVIAGKFPDFSRSVSHQDFEDGRILPYLSHKHIQRKSGFSNVYRVEIHPEYCDTKDERKVYALKTLKSNEPEDFRYERKVLEKLRHGNHSHAHLVALLATYKHKNQYHLIFPLADLDLFGYWKRKPQKSAKMELWMVRQFHGLAEALYKVHRYFTSSRSSLLQASIGTTRTRMSRTVGIINEEATSQDKLLYGRHGDLKPENILWYPNQGFGVLKITDFGGSHFNENDEWSLKSNQRVPKPSTYRSPEVDIDGTCSTLCDVWAMGCIILEFITWYQGSPRSLERFAKQRLTHDITLHQTISTVQSDIFFDRLEQNGEPKAKVKGAVINEISGLYARESSSHLKGLLEIVRNKMLVVKPEHLASDAPIAPAIDPNRLYPQTSIVTTTIRSRRHSQGAYPSTITATIQESEALQTPIPQGRSASQAIQHAIGDILTQMEGPVNTSRKSTAQDLSLQNAVPKRFSLPERILTSLHP